MDKISNIEDFFADQLKSLNCDQDTKAYIISVMSKFKSATDDLSDRSITLTFAQARNKQDFYTFQNLGDWLFFTHTFVPSHLNDASEEYYITVGRLSYYSCYKMLNRQWRLYERMADDFIPLSRECRNIIRKF